MCTAPCATSTPSTATRQGPYVLSRFDDVWRAVHDHDTFSSVVEEAQNLLPQMIYMDPPRHTALRALVSRAFTPKRVAAVEALRPPTARELSATIAERGECELQHEFAAILPSVVIARMIGVPDEHVAVVPHLDRVVPRDPGTPGFRGGRWQDLRTVRRTPRRAASAATRRPHDRTLIDAEAEGQRLSDEELLGFCLLLILAGNDTTSSLIGSGIVLLLEYPDQRARARARSVAVAQCHRGAQPPGIAGPGTAPHHDTRRRVHGMTIPADSRVMLIWGAANHDDREFPEPRAPRRHAEVLPPSRVRTRHPLLPRRQSRPPRSARGVRRVARTFPALRATTGNHGVSSPSGRALLATVPLRIV